MTIVTICDQMWPPVTRCWQICKYLWVAKKGNVWPNLVNMNPCDPCDHMWPPVTRWYQTAESCGRPKKVTHPNQIWSVRARVVIMTICDHQLPNPVTPVTHSKYSSYPFQILQLLQLPISVTPVTVSRYCSYPLQLLQLSILVTPVTHSSYPHQLLQLPIPVTPVTHSSYSRYPLQLPQLFKLLQLHQLPNSPPPSISHRSAGTFRSRPCFIHSPFIWDYSNK